MAPEGFAAFFLASTGAGAAFVGLLFVAISIGPQRTFGDPVGLGAPRQHLAEATFLTLVNGFVVSSVALIPGVNVGWITLAFGVAGALIAVHLIWLFARAHRHGAARLGPWRHLLRVAGLSLIALAIYASEVLLGLRLVLRSADADAFRWLALLVIGLYALGILRAWTLLGDPQHGLSGWLNSLRDLPPGDELGEPPAGPS